MCIQKQSKLAYHSYILSSLLLLLLLSVGTGWAVEKQEQYNRLIHEKSPYLLQHASNPIWWYPWGDEAFEAARRENKPIFLSIGYSTCHWCHVMEGDSFTSKEVATILNEHFIAIKVDREERPDVDQIYMDIVVAMRGHGGWPLTVFMEPDLVPFMGASFIPKAEFMQILQQIGQVWKNDRQRIAETTQQVSAWLEQQEDKGFLKMVLPEDQIFQQFLEDSKNDFDPEYGGFGESPKFPHSMQLGLLLRIYKRTGDDQALVMTQKTLDGMARGAMYDQLGGGFHRYSTDQYWHIPHFEKMLYSNAMLAVNYLEAFQIIQHVEYSQVARGILDYILRDMTHAQGGFYSAEDADSEKTEGKFYVWHEEELKKVLSKAEFDIIAQTYHVTKEGNFNPEERVKELERNAGMKAVENANAFFLKMGQKLPDNTDPVLVRAREKLFKIRSARIRPGLDDKILTAWNGLTITAFAKAYQVLGEARYLDAARQAAHFLLKNLRTADGKLFRVWRAGAANHNAYLNDYAFLIQGLLMLYQSDFDRYWYETAVALQKHQDALFWDESSGSYYFSDASDASLLQRKRVMHDGALPAANAVAALNLLQLTDLSLNQEFKQKAARVISADGLRMFNLPTGYSGMLIALDYLLDRSKEVAVIGSPHHPATQEVVGYLHRHFFPNQVVAVGLPVEEESQKGTTIPLLFNKPMLKGKPTTYVCENNICQLPTSDFMKIQGFVNQHKPYSWVAR